MQQGSSDRPPQAIISLLKQKESTFDQSTEKNPNTVRVRCDLDNSCRVSALQFENGRSYEADGTKLEGTIAPMDALN